MMAAVIIRNGMAPLLEQSGLAVEPMRAMRLLFNILKWIAAALSLTATAAVFALHKARELPGAFRRTEYVPTDWRMITRLAGLATTFLILNSLLQMRFFPLISGAVGAYRPFYPALIFAVLLLGFLAGRSALFVKGKAGSFLRILLVPMIMLFILMPVLHFLNDENLFFAPVMNSLVNIAAFSAWIIFTTAIVELYRGQRFFYAAAPSVLIMYSLMFLGPLLGPVIPKGPGFMVLVSAVAALLFTILAFRILFPGLRLLAENEPEAPAYSLRTIFLEHGLNEKEAEVARLIVTEGLSNQKIAERILRSKPTVEKHLTSIYRKFGVPDRTAFLAKVLK
jgi:DNA-binding CsgD family transcriptional regulator